MLCAQRHIRAALSLVFSSLILCPSVQAAQRTFVSTAGSDSNTASNCSNTAPCRGFAAALTVTDSGGEIIVQNSGGYGPVTINKSVSIIAPEGVYAGISVLSGNGIAIATAGVDVVLRGLSINGLGGTEGINMTGGNELAVESTHVSNFGGDGLIVSAPARVRILRSVFVGNNFNAYFEGGAQVKIDESFFAGGFEAVTAHASGSDVTRVAITRSSSAFCHNGFSAISDTGGTSVVTVLQSAVSQGNTGYYVYASAAAARLEVKDSESSGNLYGALVDGDSGGSAQASVTGSLIAGNSTYGLYAHDASSTLTASGNTVKNNGFGFVQASSAVFRSTGDNVLVDNVFPTSGTITAQSKM